MEHPRVCVGAEHLRGTGRVGLLFERDIGYVWAFNFNESSESEKEPTGTDKNAKQPMTMRRHNQICRSDISFSSFSVRTTSSCSEIRRQMD